ncbi:hypothetical protein EKO29_07145 [Colwellia sp. Arc7-635]|uniref:hypothetical protein n=1 Tax=Colwellia sp. Arc7-635 TaxID=2497879 RepID=UPI000F85B563|nr:hypothetical protein [Colwellia sp. Arc7-635]AZQ83821.1 hypothetical protein EKO29_07145 [Colwellia sp. Arc7-635]
MTNQTTVRQHDKTSAKYLAQYAEPEVQSLASFPAEFTYQHVLVIPAFMESAQFIERFVKSKLAEQQCLLIVVVNQPDNDFGQQHQQAQIDLAQSITAQGEQLWQQDNLQLVDLCHWTSNKSVNSAILTVDRYHQPIPAEQGVGLARKIGADLAVALYFAGKITSSWVHSSDADAYLPDNYLIAHTDSDVQGDDKFKSAVASCCNFYHYSENQAIHQANWLYERALRYYVAGLHFAKSPYAYFTIGSTLSFNMLAYCQARGFPKRSAGEDFYLLNKLAKLGDIVYLADVTIKLDARPSQRVPFGTGPAVQGIMQLIAQEQDYQYYHPEIFIELKACLQAFEHLWQEREQPEQWLTGLSQGAQQALKNIGLLTFIAKQKSAKQAQFNKQLIVWFDSFKTLKFIHARRDLGLGNIALEQAITAAPFSISNEYKKLV